MLSSSILSSVVKVSPAVFRCVPFYHFSLSQHFLYFLQEEIPIITYIHRIRKIRKKAVAAIEKVTKSDILLAFEINRSTAYQSLQSYFYNHHHINGSFFPAYFPPTFTKKKIQAGTLRQPKNYTFYNDKEDPGSNIVKWLSTHNNIAFFILSMRMPLQWLRQRYIHMYYYFIRKTQYFNHEDANQVQWNSSLMYILLFKLHYTSKHIFVYIRAQKD